MRRRDLLLGSAALLVASAASAQAKVHPDKVETVHYVDLSAKDIVHTSIALWTFQSYRDDRLTMSQATREVVQSKIWEAVRPSLGSVKTRLTVESDVHFDFLKRNCPGFTRMFDVVNTHDGRTVETITSPLPEYKRTY